ncbi:MAG: hypothetical protein ACI8RD_014224 [Bacillariaceae sp.]|jgi:hypothetical protein
MCIICKDTSHSGTLSQFKYGSNGGTFSNTLFISSFTGQTLLGITIGVVAGVLLWTVMGVAAGGSSAFTGGLGYL